MPEEKIVKTGKQNVSLNAEHEKLKEWFQTVRFRKKRFGGIDEKDVWLKMEELNGMYEAALIAERARYDTLLQKQRNSIRKSLNTSKPPNPRKEIKNGNGE